MVRRFATALTEVVINEARAMRSTTIDPASHGHLCLEPELPGHTEAIPHPAEGPEPVVVERHVYSTTLAE